MWIDVLLGAGVPVDVCHVRKLAEEAKAKASKSGAKTRGKKKQNIKQEQLVESEDEEEVDQLMDDPQDTSSAPNNKRQLEEEASPERVAKRRA